MALAVFSLGLALTSAAFFAAVVQQESVVRADVSRRTGTLAAALQREIATRTALLDALASHVVVTRAEDRSGLRNFLAALLRERSASAALDWMPRVPADTVKAFEEKQWLEGLADFRVHRGKEGLPEAREYFPVFLGVGAGARVDGLDLSPGSDLSALPAWEPVFATARVRRAVVAAPPVTVARPEGSKSALPLLAPVFAAGAGTEAAGELLGYVLGLFGIEDLMVSVVVEPDRGAISVDLRDVTPGATATPLFLQRAMRSENDGMLVRLWELTGVAPVETSRTVEVGGRLWSLAVSAGPLLLASHLSWVPWIIVLIGLAVSTILAWTVSGYETRGTVLANARRRLSSERREYMEKVSRLTEDLEREKLDRRRTEESLFREKQQFRLMFNSVPAMITYKDTKNRFLLVNEAAASSMGRTVEEMEGKPCSEIIPAKAYELYRDDLEIVQSGKPKLGLIEETQLPNGKTIWTRTDKLPEYDAMGRVVGILVFSQDITEHREAEAEVRRLNEELEQRVGVRTAELRAANQELESFAYSVSHDLRTPLRTIDGFSKLIIEEHGEELSPPAHEYLGRLRGAAQRMGHLIDDLLKLTRVSRAELRREQVDLSALARETIEDLRRMTPQRRVDVVIEATPFASGDPVLLANVIDNLIGNAWKFTARRPEPRIEFGSRTVAGDRTAFYVRDNGVGFDMVYADKLFGAFQRLHSHEEFEGSGIGLATVQLIIRRHGGEVWAESAPDQGATFFFTLGS